MESADLDFNFKIDLSDNTASVKTHKNDEKLESPAEETKKNENIEQAHENNSKKSFESKDNNNLSKTPSNISKEENTKDESLTSIVEKAIEKSNLREFIHLKGEELVSSNNCIKQLKIEGRVPRESETELNELQVDIYEKLSVKLGPNFRKEQFWLVECGMRAGEKYQKLEVYNSDSQAVEIIHEPGTVLIIDFWSYWSEIHTYLNHRVQTMMKIEDGKIEGVSLDKIRTASISGEENFKVWNQISNNESLKKYIPQYHSELIYHLVGVEKIPSIMLVNKEGIISYLGTFRDINLEKSIQNILHDKEVLLNNLDETANYENNPNSWWIELDNESKIDIVREINIQLRHMGSCFSSFVMVTNSVHSKGSVKNVSLPMFLGTMSEREYENVQGFAIELQNSWNLNDFKFNVKILNY